LRLCGSLGHRNPKEVFENLLARNRRLEMNNNYFKVLVISLLLSGFFGIMACATGGGGMNYGPATPQGDYLTPSDPEYWKMWGSSRGLG
jgi:hypothetical protein